MSVESALETIAEETKSNRVNDLIKKLRNGFYGKQDVNSP
jgi:hypothetical protein